MRQLPVDAEIHRQDLAVEVDDVEIFDVVIGQAWDLCGKREKIVEEGAVRFRAVVANLVDVFFQLVLFGRVRGSHPLEPFCGPSVSRGHGASRERRGGREEGREEGRERRDALW